MDATCKVQDNIHVFRLVHNMCPGFWVHIKKGLLFFLAQMLKEKTSIMNEVFENNIFT